MDDLDKLKNSWKKSTENYPKFSAKEIYAMLHKRSSSIVKWILVISITEFTLWLVISFLLSDSSQMKRINSLHLNYITTPLEIINYLIILYFMYLFYTNYRRIKVTDNAKRLMQSILKTRKAVTNYIITVIIYNFISMMLLFVLFFMYDPDIIGAEQQFEANGNLGWFYVLYILIALLATGIILLLFWLFYKLIYGLLLKRLNRNYNELKKLDF